MAFTLWSFIGWANKTVTIQGAILNYLNLPFYPPDFEIISQPTDDIPGAGYVWFMPVNSIIAVDLGETQATETNLYVRFNNLFGGDTRFRVEASTDGTVWDLISAPGPPPPPLGFFTVGPFSLSGYRLFRLNKSTFADPLGFTYGYVENLQFPDSDSSRRSTMPALTADVIVTNKHVRDWIQFNGPSPLNAPKYYGTDAQYMKMEGLSMPDGQGAISPRYMHDPRRIGKFKLVARQVSAPDLNAANLIMTENHGAIPRQLQKINCPVNIYESVGECTDPADFLKGWSDYILVYENGLIDGNKDGGNRSAWGDADDQIEDSLPMKFDDIYPIGALEFGDQATGIITLEVIDVVYVKGNDCVNCDDGTQWIYAIVKSSGSTPGTAPRLIYSTNGGDTWTQGSVDSLGDTEDPSGIDVVGRYLVVYTRTAGGATTSGYYYSEINQNTGVPGTWTKVTTGFVAGFQVRDMYVLSPREVYFCADDGYIYFTDDITTGVSVRSASSATVADLYRIHGDSGETIVATGIGGVVVVSTNRGKTFATTISNPHASATIQALCVVNESLWWVGGANGKLYYTLTGGEVWAEKTFSGSGAGQVRDIVKVTPSVLYFSHDTATPTGRIFSTWDGGRDWTNTPRRILNTPTANRFNRLAVPPTDAGVAANNLAVAGLGGNGTDGILLLGIASRL